MQHRRWDTRDDDVVIYDRERGVFADPSKVREIDFQGEFFRSTGRHFVAPSPQRRPVLWQVDSSEPRREFASKHAESVFGVALAGIEGATALRALFETFPDLRLVEPMQRRGLVNLHGFTRLPAQLGTPACCAPW